MSDSLQTKKTGEEKSETKVQFKSDNIGRWVSKQENPFAEQNRKTQAKKQKQAEQRKKSAPFVVAVVGVLAVAAGVCGLVFLVISLINDRPTLPDDLALGSAGATEIQDEAQSIYDDSLANSSGQNDEERMKDALEAAKNFFNSKKSLATDEATKNDLDVLEMQLYSDNDQLQAVIDMGESLDFDAMGEEQRGQCYSMLLNAAYNAGDVELGQYYLEKILEYNDSMTEIEGVDENDIVEK